MRALIFLLVHLQAYLRQYGYLNDAGNPQEPRYLEEIINALR